MSYSVSQIIGWAKSSQALAFIGEIKRQALNGGPVDLDLHKKLYVERKSLEWQLAQDPSDSDGILYGQKNYVYALCGSYVFAAMQASGGGSVIIPGNPTTSGGYYVINTEAVSSDPTDGSPTIGSFVYQSDLLVGATQLFYIIVNNTMETILMGDFSFDSATGSITRLNPWQEGDKVQIPFVRA
jgi:hypothetical protein